MGPAHRLIRFSPRDRRDLIARGLRPRDARRQARLLRRPPPFPPLLRPCSIGDGIERLSRAERDRLARLARSADHAGRFSRFIPASGAATRLFHPLLQLDRARKESRASAGEVLRQGGAPFSRDAFRFFSELDRFALRSDLAKILKKIHQKNLPRLLAKQDLDPLLDALLGPKGLDLARRPKGLIPFHRIGPRSRTAFEEQVVESSAFADKTRPVRVHFTVLPEHLAEYRRLGRQVSESLKRRSRGLAELKFSVQDASLDTLALDADGGWVRRSDGGLLFRPGGHGALLANLEGTGGDLVFIKNIDNVPTPSHQAEGNLWRAALAGRLIEAQETSGRWIQAVRARNSPHGIIRQAENFIRVTLGSGVPRGLTLAQRRARVVRLLTRPWRVCGMVPNRGEPGGGPFWVTGGEGPFVQIVEASQIPHSREALLGRATHFNPVDMVVGLRDFRGKPFRLSPYADPSAAMVSRKHFEGQDILTLEHPGLWNGGMAHWNTIFVEIPARVFHPVKTINDLLRPGHRANR
ncbi:MAG: DUF4301 family protein [Elusimicrobia bacterium]|nr:DUF4301 family protein [Elusimicrobiota bacterium]